MNHHIIMIFFSSRSNKTSVMLQMRAWKQHKAGESSAGEMDFLWKQREEKHKNSSDAYMNICLTFFRTNAHKIL